MVFFPKSYDDMVSKGLQALKDNTNITQMSPGAKTRFLLDTVYEEQVGQHNLFDLNLAQAFISLADERFLPYFGDMLNLPILEATKAIATSDNVMFYVDSGTFGDINSNQSFVISAGTIVYTESFADSVITPGVDSQPIINYVLTENVTCHASSSFAYASVQAVVEGSQSNVTRNTLVKHNFTGYSLSSSNVLKCTNRYDIQTGRDRETPSSYRFRLLNKFKAGSVGMLTSIRLASLSTPGVADITEIACEQGCGTYSLYVQGLTPATSNDLLIAVDDNISKVTAYGIRAMVFAPRLLGLDFIIAPQWSPRAKDTDVTSGYIAIRNTIETVLNETEIGENVFLPDLIDIILKATPLLVGIGRERPNFFEEVYVTKGVPGSTRNDIIRTLVTGDSVSTLSNERIILETSGRHRGIQFR